MASQLNLATEEKAKIESNMKAVQETIAREQEAARIAAEERAKAEVRKSRARSFSESASGNC